MRSLAISQRIWREFRRDKRTLVLVFFAPLLILWLLNVMFAANTQVKVKLATMDLTPAIVQQLEQTPGVTLRQYDQVTQARRAVTKHQVDGMIYQQATRFTATYANLDPSKTTYAKQVLHQALLQSQLQQSQAAGQPGKTMPRPTIQNHYLYGDADTGFFAKIAPILMGFFVFFFVFLISGMALLKERTSGTLERLLATPVRRSEVVLGYLFGYGVLALVQASVIAVAGVKLLQLEVAGSIGNVILVAVLLGLVALAFGLLMSTFAASEFQLMQFIPLIIVPQIFFSGIIPLSSMADWVQEIGKILPLTYAGDALSRIILAGEGLRAVQTDLVTLGGFLVGLVLLNIWGLKRYRKG